MKKRVRWNPGGSWPTNIGGGAAGKSEKLPCPGVKFSKTIQVISFVILCFGTKIFVRCSKVSVNGGFVVQSGT